MQYVVTRMFLAKRDTILETLYQVKERIKGNDQKEFQRSLLKLLRAFRKLEEPKAWKGNEKNIFNYA